MNKKHLTMCSFAAAALLGGASPALSADTSPPDTASAPGNETISAKIAAALAGLLNPSQSTCNQGVGNGPDPFACDPANSNQGNFPTTNSNDQSGGVPGAPGRKGGNSK